MCGRIGAMTDDRLMSMVWSTVWQDRRRKSSELEMYNLGRKPRQGVHRAGQAQDSIGQGSQHKGRQRVKGQTNNTKVGTCRVLADVYFVCVTKREPSACAL